MNKLILILAFSIAFISIKAQDSLFLKKTIELKDIQHFSFDKKGFLYVADKKSNVFKYDSTGKEIFHYSPKRPSEAKSFDATNTSQILVFSEERQEYTLLDWLLSPIEIKGFKMDEFGFVSIVGQSNTNMLWILDNVNFTLTKYNVKTNTKIVETNLEFIIQHSLHPLYIKEYENFLYISTEKNGILVFDNLGNYKKKIPFNNIPYFDFQNNEIYWNNEGEVIFFNLQNFYERRMYIGKKGTLKILNQEYYLLQEHKIEIYRNN